MQKDFIAHASHEIKTPISIILANAEIMFDLWSDDKNFKEQMPLLKAVVRQSLQLKNLLESLLSIARLDSDKNEIFLEMISVHELINQLIESLGHSNLKIENLTNTAQLIYCDRGILNRIAIIIIENAQKYASENSQLKISTNICHNFIDLIFFDNGPGIPKHLRERVFERFFRVKSGYIKEKGGSGLGLSIARYLSDQVNASIFVDEKSQPGCSIVVRLQRN
jgi:K+-sensing histidine kinase KdpD